MWWAVPRGCWEGGPGSSSGQPGKPLAPRPETPGVEGRAEGPLGLLAAGGLPTVRGERVRRGDVLRGSQLPRAPVTLSQALSPPLAVGLGRSSHDTGPFPQGGSFR